MIKMHRRKSVILIILLFLVSSFLITTLKAQENEDILYLTDSVQEGGVLESKVILDSESNLHTFLLVKNSNGTRLVHLYYIDGEVNFDVISDFAQGIHLLYCYTDGTKVGIVYSEDTELGAREFRVYEKQDSFERDVLIFQLTGEAVTWYVTFYKFLYHDGMIHAFHNIYWGGNMENMNITHYWGPPGGTIFQESFYIADSNTKDVIEIVIDQSYNIWYIYVLRQDNYGIGIGELDDLSFTLIPVTTRTFSEVLYPVPKFIATRCDPADGLLAFTFINPFKLYWGYFNGISISEDVQSTFYEHPIDFEFMVDDSDTAVIVFDEVDDNIVNIHHMLLSGATWSIHSIQSQQKVKVDKYAAYLEGANYVVIFSKIVNTRPYGPDKPLAFRKEVGLALFVLTDMVLETVLYIESLEIYNPTLEFFVTKWWVLVIIGVVLIILGLALWIALKKRKKEIKAFLTDTQVGEGHSKFVLFFLNIGRLIRNGFSTIFTIWLSNKKRSILTLAGFIITGYLLSSAVIIAQSEESAMIKAFDRSFPLIADKEISAKLETSFITGNFSIINPNYGVDAEQEILNLYDGMTVDNYIDGLVSGYRTILKVYKPELYVTLDYRMVGLPNDCDDFLETMMMEGRLPQNGTEVVITDQLSRRANLHVNDTMTLSAWADFWLGGIGSPPDEENYLINCTVVGIYERISLGQAKRVSEHLGIPYDIYTIASENADIITKQNCFFNILCNGNKMHLGMWGYYQLLMNFDEFSVADRTDLVDEQIKMQPNIYKFSFDPTASISVQVMDQQNDEESTELRMFFEAFNDYYLNNMARLLVFAIPAILLSIFMVFESSDLFSSSYEQEMEILRNRGLSTGRLFWTYLIIRLAEIVVASLASFGVAVGTAIPLIKIDGFISFTNTDTHLVTGNIPMILGLVVGVLFLVSVPRILILVRRKRKIEKGSRITRRKVQKTVEPTYAIPKEEILIPGKQPTDGASIDAFAKEGITLPSYNKLIRVSGILFIIVGGLNLAIDILALHFSLAYLDIISAVLLTLAIIVLGFGINSISTSSYDLALKVKRAGYVLIAYGLFSILTPISYLFFPIAALVMSVISLILRIAGFMYLNRAFRKIDQGLGSIMFPIYGWYGVIVTTVLILSIFLYSPTLFLVVSIVSIIGEILLLIGIGIKLYVNAKKLTSIEKLTAGQPQEYEITFSTVVRFFMKSGILSWRDIFFLGLGFGLFYYFYEQAFTAFDTQAVSDFTLYLFLTIAGAIFTLIGGLPFAVKILGLIQKSISSLLWKYKKSRFNFSLSEIGKDIRHFENITLIFLLVVLIIVPVLVVPYSKEIILTEQAYFMNGADVRIMYWDDTKVITLEDLDPIPQIKSYTNVKEYTLYTGTFDQARLLVVNVTNFMKTMTVPSSEVTTVNWNLIALLNSSNVLISNPMKSFWSKSVGDTFEFIHPDVPAITHTLTIIGSFNLFPVFFSQWDLDNEEQMMIVSTEAFEALNLIIYRRLKFRDEIFIKTYYERDAETVVDKLYDIEQGLTIDTMNEVKSTLKTPLYNIFIIEMLLSLFVATGVLIFSTFTTAIKILEKRVIKHDIMKKMGINSTRIITMSTVQTMLAAIIPALAVGAGVGFTIISPIIQQLNYGAAPYAFYIKYPYIMIGVLFVGIPVLIYLCLRYFLKREFSKYAPTMME